MNRKNSIKIFLKGSKTSIVDEESMKISSPKLVYDSAEKRRRNTVNEKRDLEKDIFPVSTPSAFPKRSPSPSFSSPYFRSNLSRPNSPVPKGAISPLKQTPSPSVRPASGEATGSLPSSPECNSPLPSSPECNSPLPSSPESNSPLPSSPESNSPLPSSSESNSPLPSSPESNVPPLPSSFSKKKIFSSNSSGDLKIAESPSVQRRKFSLPSNSKNPMLQGQSNSFLLTPSTSNQNLTERIENKPPSPAPPKQTGLRKKMESPAPQISKSSNSSKKSHKKIGSEHNIVITRVDDKKTNDSSNLSPVSKTQSEPISNINKVVLNSSISTPNVLENVPPPIISNSSFVQNVDPEVQLAACIKIQRFYKKWLVIRNDVLEYRKLSKAHRKRTLIVQEILSTERTYLSSLKILLQGIIQPLRLERPLIVPEVLHLTFNEIDKIVKFHSDFISLLEDVIEKNWFPRQKIGHIFINMAPKLLQYDLYATMYNNSIEPVQHLLNYENEFSSFISRCYKNLNSNLDLPSFLIMPIQRIPRYVLLLENLQKCTSIDHIDYEFITSALNSMKNVASTINEQLREAENYEKLGTLQKEIHGLPLPLVKRGRSLVKMTTLQTLKDEIFTLYLFSDILIWGIPRNHSTKTEFYRVDFLEDISATPYHDNEGRHALTLISLTSAAVTILFESEIEKEIWEKAFNVDLDTPTSKEEKLRWLQKNDSKRPVKKVSSFSHRISVKVGSMRESTFRRMKKLSNDNISADIPKSPSLEDLQKEATDAKETKEMKSLYSKLTSSNTRRRKRSKDVFEDLADPPKGEETKNSKITRKFSASFS